MVLNGVRNTLVAVGLFFCSVQGWALTGYIEGEYRYLSAPESGWIERSLFVEGQRIERGELAFSLDERDQQLALVQTQAQARQAQAQWENTLMGAREVELLVLQRQKEEVQANLRLAQATLIRYEKLLKSRAISALEVDQMRANVKALSASVNALDSELAAQALPAREQEIAAAKAGLATAHANEALAQEALSRRRVISRLSGEITRVYHYPGEFVSAGAAVLQVLPEDARKVIFFVPQAQLSALRVGEVVTVRGDGAGQSDAVIRWINDRAEYTPPVLYTEKSRSDLVFRVEARLQQPLPIGLPVDVVINGDSHD